MITSKAETLRYLRPLIKKSKIEKIFYFSVQDWRQNQHQIMTKISKIFQADIIIRSSAVGEDSLISSQAGVYTSVLNVNSRNKSKIRSGVNQVIKSYTTKNNFSNTNRKIKPYKLHSIARQKILLDDNQILVQRQTKSILISGVILSRDPNSGSPYFIINYEQDNSTDSVTKGASNNVIKIYRFTAKTKIPQQWKKLIDGMIELEKILKNDKLDVEFAINKKNEIIIFQVRVLTQLFGQDYTLTDKTVKRKLEILSKSLINKEKNSVLFSDMADWNPSEIIGTNPNPLSYSLYDYLIMNYSWYKGRTNLGYKKPISEKLMSKIGNKPYVNLENSFSSFFPYSFSETTIKKLVRYYAKKISSNPYLHDKIEFFIIFSCFDLSVPSRLNELIRYGFTEKEIILIQNQLVDFTNNILLKFNSILNDCKNSINEMEIRRNSMLKKYKNLRPNYHNLLELNKILLNDCKVLGTIPFSTMARLAFISSALLKSIFESKLITTKQYYSVFSTVNSPMIEFQKDMQLLIKNKINKNTFLKKYGHLRPGTYDITVKRYDQSEFSIQQSINFQKNIPRIKIDNKKINAVLRQNKLQFNFEQLIDFIQQTLYYREKFKMEFSRNVSDALELIKKAGSKLGFTKDEISFMDINLILNFQNNRLSTKNKWNAKINKNRKKFLQNELLQLPPFLKSKRDLYVIKNLKSRPNFVTKKSVLADVVLLTKNTMQEVKNKIIVIENADPGFDWIFSKNPAGLIAKYGGVASHMAIRCSEIGLPAAIGCGQTIFSKVETAERVKLDCKNQRISLF